MVLHYAIVVTGWDVYTSIRGARLLCFSSPPPTRRTTEKDVSIFGMWAYNVALEFSCEPAQENNDLARGCCYCYWIQSQYLDHQQQRGLIASSNATMMMDGSCPPSHDHSKFVLVAVCLRVKRLSFTIINLFFLHLFALSTTFAFAPTGFGVISTPIVERGFRNVDRRFFVPKVRCDELCDTN